MEIWKDIAGFEGLYQVSSYGNVKSLARQAGTAFLKEKLLRKKMTQDGYEFVCLSKDMKQSTFRVHRLVATAFVNGDSGLTVNHKDGNKLNNHVENLEWCDRSEQLKHAYKMGLRKAQKGCLNKQAKLTREDVIYIRQHYKRQSTEFGTVALAKKFNVSDRVIGLIVRGLSYQDIK